MNFHFSVSLSPQPFEKCKFSVWLLHLMLGFVHLRLVFLVFSIRFQVIPGASGSSSLFWAWGHAASFGSMEQIRGWLFSGPWLLMTSHSHQHHPAGLEKVRCANRKLDEL